MSAIFGAFFKSVNKTEINHDLNCLSNENSKYGSLKSISVIDDCGFGTYHNTLSDKCNAEPFDLKIGKKYAVIDAVLYNRQEVYSFLDNNVNYEKVSDEELLLIYIQKYGFDALKNINGDFAGAIYDSEYGIWILFRDHMGIRPLFYYVDDNKFVFSTDMRGIVSFPNADLSLNEEHLYLQIMGYNELTLCETEYKNIKCISPASWNVIKKTTNVFSLEEHIYWKLGERKIHLSSMQEYQNELRRLIIDSIKRRLEAVSGPVGCELSGGLDSSVIAILINRLGREEKCFSWSWSPNDYPLQNGEDERKVIFDICEQENIDCSFAKKNEVDDLKPFNEAISKGDVPYINTFYLGQGSEKVRELGAKVMFTGQGGDEGVSHRCNPYELWYNKEYLAFFKTIWRNQNGKSLHFTRFAYNVLRQFFVVHPGLRKEFHKTYNMEQFLNPDFKEKMKNTLHPLHTFAYDPIKYIMQGGERHRLDNCAYQGAMHEIQYMFPFLDYRVIDYAVSIPRECFQNGRGNRWIYRQAFDDIMPESLKNVRYKDTPSTRDFVPDGLEELRKHMLQYKEDILNYLDKDYWGKYFNFEELEKITLKENYNELDNYVFSNQLDNLLYCALIQNLNTKLSNKTREE